MGEKLTKIVLSTALALGLGYGIHYYYSKVTDFLAPQAEVAEVETEGTSSFEKKKFKEKKEKKKRKETLTKRKSLLELTKHEPVPVETKNRDYLTFKEKQELDWALRNYDQSIFEGKKMIYIPDETYRWGVYCNASYIHIRIGQGYVRYELKDDDLILVQTKKIDQECFTIEHKLNFKKTHHEPSTDFEDRVRLKVYINGEGEVTNVTDNCFPNPKFSITDYTAYGIVDCY